MSDTNDPTDTGLILAEPLRRAIGERYLTYALSTIMHRALPDARDGLKPVHRRILYAMRELRLASAGGFRKSAKISGDVMGNYHPHGDAAIYDAMARLAQDFNVRYPLVDGQGNFGNIDGDNPAASRYTEARMTALAEALLDGLNENAVDFRDNYDGTLQEPVVLPASFPNLLANGASGIAVGMATNTMFKNSDLEVRFSLNMNVLIDGVTPKVCSLKEVLRAFLDHRRDVLVRRTTFRVEKIDHRLEVLEGLIIAFLNLDRVIDIIRYDDDPKLALIAENWQVDHVRATSEVDYIGPDTAREGELSELQAEAILNMRLRSLRRLEEMELVRERDALMEERADLSDLLASDSLQWSRVAEQLKETKKQFGKDYAGGARRSEFAEAAEAEDVPIEAMIEREPITIVCSKMGWIRAMTGHIDLNRELKYKDGDGPALIFHAETTDRLLVLGSNGRFYTVSCANLPGGRGMGEPLRLMVDLPNEAAIVTMFTYTAGTKLLVASSAGDGFIVPQDDVIAQTRTGKQVLNVKGDSVASVCRVVKGDHIAVVGENRKVLIFSKNNLAEWIAKRASAGRMAPRGFPRDNKFTS
ncbi:MAG: hypothetical protein EBW03_08955 [Rhodobacteraceae bacterium]|nr:hypothetical protein [Paracoccaceae bacterium]